MTEREAPTASRSAPDRGPPRPALVGAYATAAAVAGSIFWLAYDNGTYSLVSRTSLGIAAWWTVALAVAVGVWPRARPTRSALVVAVLIAAFALLTLVSTRWASSTEAAFDEFNRVLLYLAVFAIAVLGATRWSVGRVCDGLALGIVLTGVLALASRFLPTLVDTGDAFRFLPVAIPRLSYPVGYWNGLAILLALAIPLLLRAATTARFTAARGLALAPLPALAAAIYLTSSRGGVVTALVATFSFFVLTPCRAVTAATLLLAVPGCVAAILVLLDRPDIVNGPFESAPAVADGRSAALLIGAICVVTAVVYWASWHLTPARLAVPRIADRALLVVAVVLATAGVLAFQPVERFEAFKRPIVVSTSDENAVQAHLLSVSGNGRWQMWTTAIEEFRADPLKGGGAGSFQSWWEQHRPMRLFVRDAHSLYAEVLGELGILGFALLAGIFATGIATALRRLPASEEERPQGEAERRVTVAALTATLVGFVAAAGFDWIWELTVVSVVAIVVLGLLTGPATASVRTGAIARRSVSLPVRIGVLALGLVFVSTQAVPLLAEVELDASRAAVRRGDGEEALRAASAARRIEPWASSPHLQLALVSEQMGDLRAARRWIFGAIRRDRSNWRLWVTAARIDTKAESIGTARKSLARARQLNPLASFGAPQGP